MSTMFERVWRKSVSWRRSPTPSPKAHGIIRPESDCFHSVSHSSVATVTPAPLVAAASTMRRFSTECCEDGTIVASVGRRSSNDRSGHHLPMRNATSDTKGICAMHTIPENTDVINFEAKVEPAAPAAPASRNSLCEPKECQKTFSARNDSGAVPISEAQHRLYLRRLQRAALPPGSEATERRRARGSILIPKRPYHSNGRSFRPLRPPDTAGGGVLAPRPNVLTRPPNRAEFIESLLLPASVNFFVEQSIACRCRNCSASLCRRWNIRNGMQCLNTLPVSLVPARRTPLPLQPRSRHDVSALERCIRTAASPDEFFEQTDGFRTTSWLKRSPPKEAYRPARHGPEAVTIASPTTTPRKCSSPNACKPLLRGSAAWTAEVVVIGSSLESTPHCFHNGERIMHFFSCKGVEFFFVDLNADIGSDRADLHLIKRWRHLHWIHRDYSKSSYQKRDIVAPQVLIDGVPVGSYNELMDLDEDDDLDYILAKLACPNCLFERRAAVGRPPKLNMDGSRQESITLQRTCGGKKLGDVATDQTVDYCLKCGAVFRELVNNEVLPIPDALDTFIRLNHHSCRQYLGLPNIEGANIADSDWDSPGRDLALVQALARAARYRETLLVELPND